MKKKLLVLVMGGTLVMGLTACGGASNTSTTEKSAQTIFLQNCSSCHGDQLEGGVGPGLKKVGSEFSKAQILKIIKDGKNNGKMPAELITGNDADKVAAWLAAKK